MAFVMLSMECQVTATGPSMTSCQRTRRWWCLNVGFLHNPTLSVCVMSESVRMDEFGFWTEMEMDLCA